MSHPLAPASLQGGRPAPRDAGVDVVRGLALASMYVAHTAPTGGPGGVLVLSELVTAPLFAALIGVGAALSHRLTHEGGLRRDLASATVRGLALIILGLWLGRAGAQVHIVLVHLGALTLLMPALVRLRWWGLVVLGLGAVKATQPIAAWARGELPGTSASPGSPAWLTLDLLGVSHYSLVSMVAHGCLGLLLARLLVVRTPIAQISAGAAGLVLAAVALALARAGRVELVPYGHQPLDILTSMLLVTGAVGVGMGIVRMLTGAGAGWAAAPLAASGRMALTFYTLQVLALAWYVRSVAPTDDSWVVLGALLAGTLVAAPAWAAVFRGTGLARGPLEAVTDAAVRAARKGVTGARPSAAEQGPGYR